MSAPIEVDATVSLPVAYGSLRRVLAAALSDHPSVGEAAALAQPAAWNRLFPGTVDQAPDLYDQALTPSERRLHRESEQVYVILNLAARTLVNALRESGQTLLIRNAGAADLVSLRGLMRAREWGRLEGLEDRIQLEGFDVRPEHVAAAFQSRRTEQVATLARRMRLLPPPTTAARVVHAPAALPVDAEGRYLVRVMDASLSPEERVAAAVLAARACFFSSNYEGTFLAAEQALALLESVGESFSAERVRTAWDALDDVRMTSPAVEIDAQSLGGPAELRALLRRCVGVTHVFMGDFDAGLATFQRALEDDVCAETRAHLRMFRALTLIKRLQRTEEARTEIDRGLAELPAGPAASARLHEGWLRNVKALTYFQEKRLDEALAEERLAMQRVGALHGASATHLKINLISNVSVLLETAKRYDDALQTWARFDRMSAQSGENFRKHHRYRQGGLELFSGQRGSALTSYEGALESARELRDPFHAQSITAELGRLRLDEGKKDEAHHWFEQATEAARSVGDPYRIAQSLAGLALSEDRTDFSDAARTAGLTESYPLAAAALQQRMASGDADAIRTELPSPKTRLNRPFDLVNL